MTYGNRFNNHQKEPPLSSKTASGDFSHSAICLLLTGKRKLQKDLTEEVRTEPADTICLATAS